MIQAFVSGKAARVALVQGTDVTYFNAHTPEKDIPSTLAQLKSIFLHVDDVEVLKVDAREQTYSLLLSKYNLDRGLHLLDVALTDEDIEFRQEAASLFEKIIDHEPSINLIKKYVLSVHNPDIIKNLDLNELDGFSTKYLDFITEVRKAQVHILRINAELDKTFKSLQTPLEVAEEFRNAAIEHGAFRGLVEAGSERTKANRAILECYTALSSIPNSRQIIQKWTNDLIHNTTKTELLRLEKEFQQYEDKSYKPKDGSERTSYDTYQAVKRQLAVIIEKIKTRDNRTARIYADQLIKMQLQNGRAIYAAKSLTSLAFEARKIGQFSLEMQWAEASVELVPDDARGIGLLADTYLRLSRIPEAEASFKKSIALGMDEFGHVGLGRVQRACGKFDEALETFLTVKSRLKDENLAAETWSAYAETLRDMNREHEALQVYDNAIRVNHSSPILLCGKAAVLADLGRLNEAANLYKSVNSRLGDQATAWCGLAETYKIQGKWDEALETYSIAISKFPDSVVSHCGYADVLRAQRHFQDALDAYQTAVKKFPYSPYPLSGEAETLKDMRSYSRALELFKTAQSKFPLDQHLRNGYANALKLNGQYSEALRQFELNVRDFPYNLHALSGRANLLKLLGNYDAALLAYNDIIIRRPDYQFAQNAKASIHVARGEYQLADTLLPHNVPLTEVEWITLHIRGMSALRQNQIDYAIEIFEKGSHSPFYKQRVAFEAALAIAKMKQGDLATAYNYVEASTDDISQLIAVHILLKQGEQTSAKARLDAVNDNVPQPILQMKSHLRLVVNNDVSIVSSETEEIWYNQEIELILQAA